MKRKKRKLSESEQVKGGGGVCSSLYMLWLKVLKISPDSALIMGKPLTHRSMSSPVINLSSCGLTQINSSLIRQFQALSLLVKQAVIAA